MEKIYDSSAAFQRLQLMRYKVQEAKKASGEYEEIEGLEPVVYNEKKAAKALKKQSAERDYDL